jgi:hypothetical protein
MIDRGQLSSVTRWTMGSTMVGTGSTIVRTGGRGGAERAGNAKAPATIARPRTKPEDTRSACNIVSKMYGVAAAGAREN